MVRDDTCQGFSHDICGVIAKIQQIYENGCINVRKYNNNSSLKIRHMV